MADAGNAGGWNRTRPGAGAGARGLAGVGGVGNPPQPVVACMRNPVHSVQVNVLWADDRSPVPAIACRIVQGDSVIHPGPLAHGQMAKQGLPGGRYEVTLPEVDAEEWDAG